MLVRALLQTSLVLWLAQQTLQGGVKVKPQSVSWGKVQPARGVGVGVRPGVAGALGALGNRYGAKAMKTGIGRYPGAQLGHGGYRALGLGGKAGLKQGGYGAQGAYGAALGTGMAMGTGLNGLGLGMGQQGKRAYGAGLGTAPGYGALAGIGYPGARPGIGLGYPTGQKAKEQKPGVSAADLGGPQMANLGQAVQDLKREKSRTLGPKVLDMRKGNILTATELHAETGFRPALLPHGRDSKGLDPAVKSSRLGPLTPYDKHNKGLSLAISQAQGRDGYEPMLLERGGTANHGAALAAGGLRQQLPLEKDNIRNLASASSQVQSARGLDLSFQQNQRGPNCGSTRDLSDVLGINHHELLGAETQRTQGLVHQPHVGKDSKHLGLATPQAQEERNYQQPLPQTQDGRGNIFSAPQGQGTGSYLSPVADGQAVRDLAVKEKSGPRIRGSFAVENPNHGSLTLQAQGRGSYGLVIPGAIGTQSLGLASVEGQEAKGFTADGQKSKHLSHAERDVTESEALSIPGQTGRNNQATSYLGGAGNYLGASLGAGGYGAGLGQGAYLGGAAGKLGAATALGQGGYPLGVVPGYGEGATGYLGAMGGNGYGYGNGYSDGQGAGLGYPSELADGAENKAGKHEALGTGGYAGQVPGALGAGLDSTGAKYGAGAAQVPYGNAPVIPTGLEGDGGYPYPAQQLNLAAEGTKTANKNGPGAGYGAQQTGYGAQLGATQDALGEQAGKYGGVNGALGNGYKG